MEVEMTIRGLMVDPVTNTPIVILKDVSGDAVLPIWVGVFEANAIALEMEKVSTPRPMTHDLIKNVLTGLETQVYKVVVTELREDTFYAVNSVSKHSSVSRSSRPVMRTSCESRVASPEPRGAAVGGASREIPRPAGENAGLRDDASSKGADFGFPNSRCASICGSFRYEAEPQTRETWGARSKIFSPSCWATQPRTPNFLPCFCNFL